VLHWNTNRIIPNEVSWRNNDFHMLDPVLRAMCEDAKKPLQIQAEKDVKINMAKKYRAQDLNRAKLNVFKFASQFYVSILQRAADKSTLPDTIRYIRAYINDDETCARWLITEFCNFDVLTECFLENTMLFMRQILGGMLYCSMLKIYDSDKGSLNYFWDDLDVPDNEP
jgi:hypothetical protein